MLLAARDLNPEGELLGEQTYPVQSEVGLTRGELDGHVAGGAGKAERAALFRTASRFRAPAKSVGEPAHKEQGLAFADTAVQDLRVPDPGQLPGPFRGSEEVRDERAPRQKGGPLEIPYRRDVVVLQKIGHGPQGSFAVLPSARV